MIYVCKPITMEYCQIAGNLAIRMNMNEHTAWLVTLASAALAFATLLCSLQHAIVTASIALATVGLATLALCNRHL